MYMVIMPLSVYNVSRFSDFDQNGVPFEQKRKLFRSSKQMKGFKQYFDTYIIAVTLGQQFEKLMFLWTTRQIRRSFYTSTFKLF